MNSVCELIVALFRSSKSNGANRRSRRRAFQPRFESLENRQLLAAVVYVDDAFTNPVPGQDPDGPGPATNFGVDAFSTIQEGVDAVDVNGLVNINPGSYPENVAIAKSVILDGMSVAAAVVINPAAGDGITITSGNVTVRDLRIQGAVDGIHQSGGGDLTLDKVELMDNSDDGVQITDDAGVVDFSHVAVIGNADQGVEATGIVAAFRDTDGVYFDNGRAAVNGANFENLTLTRTTIESGSNSSGVIVLQAGSTVISEVSATNTNTFGVPAGRGVKIVDVRGPVVVQDSTFQGFIRGLEINSALNMSPISITGGRYTNNEYGIWLGGLTGGDTQLSNTIVENNTAAGFFVLQSSGAVMVSGGSFSNNGTAGRFSGISVVGSSLTLEGVLATGNTAAGVEYRSVGLGGPLVAGSFSDTDGNYSNNYDHGILLRDVFSDVTLVRSTLEDNDADNNGVGDGLHAMDTSLDADLNAIGGDLTVLGAIIRDTDGTPQTSDVQHQRRGVFVENVGGNVRFADSTGTVQSVIVSGHDRAGVAIGTDAGYPAENGFIGGDVEFARGDYSNNVGSLRLLDGSLDGGINLAGINGQTTITDLTANNNYVGISLDGMGDVMIARSSISNNPVFGLTVDTDGSVQLSDLAVDNNSGVFFNATGLQVDADSLTIENSSFSNSVFGITAVAATADLTGVTANDNATVGLSANIDALTIRDSTFMRNGGGISTVFGTVQLTNVTVDGNAGPGLRTLSATDVQLDATTLSNNSGAGLVVDPGTGISATSGDLRVYNSTINGNGSGGIRFDGQALTVVNSTVSENYTAGDDAGGGIFAAGDLMLRNSTVFGNSTQGSGAPGGGIYHEGGTLDIDSSIVAGNRAEQSTNPDVRHSATSPMVVRHALIGNNAGTAFGAHPVSAPDAEGNLIGTESAPIDPRLAPLADNGGLTQTHALLSDSPAVNAGSNPLNLLFDQRGAGFARTQGIAADIGAFEAEAPANQPPIGDPQTVDTPEDTPLAITLGGNDGDPSATQALTFAIDNGPANGTISGFNPATGEVVYTPNADYNGPDSFSFTVTDDDTAGGPALTSIPVTVQIDVAAVNDDPTLPIDVDAAANGVAEGAVAGTGVGITANSSDGDSPSVSYRLISNAGGHFRIDANTGIVTVADGLQFDGPATHTITVEAADGQGGVSRGDFDVTVTNVAPSVAADNAAVTVDEGETAANTGRYGDPGADTVNLSASAGTIVDNGDGTWSWSLDSSGPKDSQTVTVTATDSDGATSTIEFEVQVRRVEPQVTLSVLPNTIDEGQSVVLSGQVVNSPQEHTVTISWGDGRSDSFTLALGEVSFALDHTYEDDEPSGTPADAYSVRVTVTDASGDQVLDDSQSVMVQNVAPVIETLSLSPSTVTAGAEVVFRGTFVDPGTLDTFELDVDWDGDGKFDESVPVGEGAFTLAHAFGDVAGTLEVHARLRDDDGGTTSRTASINVILASSPNSYIEDVHLFYNDTAFDANGPAVTAADFAAIDPSKQPLRFGETSGFQNVSGSHRGITGIFIDVAGLPAHGASIDAGDFAFAVGNDDHPEGWAHGPAPAGVGVLPGQGVNGSDRLHVTFAEGAVVDTWLGVTLLANVNTGLATDEAFFFGSVPGETGAAFQGQGAFFGRAAADLQSMARNNFRPAAVDNPNDVNHDAIVNAFDLQVIPMASGGGIEANVIRVITPQMPGPAMAAAAASQAPAESLPLKSGTYSSPVAAKDAAFGAYARPLTTSAIVAQSRSTLSGVIPATLMRPERTM